MIEALMSYNMTLLICPEVFGIEHQQGKVMQDPFYNKLF